MPNIRRRQPSIYFLIPATEMLEVRSLPTASVMTSIAVLNQPPIIVLPQNDVVFTQGGAPVTIFAAGEVTHLDAPDFHDGQLTVALTGNGSKGDKLSLFSNGEGTGQVSLKGKHVRFEGTEVGRLSGGKGSGRTPLVITFNDQATLDAVQAVVRSVTFQSTGRKASTATRTVQISFKDGDGSVSEAVTQQIRTETLAQRDSAPPVIGGTAQSANDTSGGLESAVRLRVDQIINTFEYSTTIIGYDRIEDIGDGRGFTAGRAGFTTATGDFLIVVQRYSEQVPDNPLAPYLPRLQELSDAGSSSVSGLNGIEDAWQTAAGDPVFRGIQDSIVDELYYRPTVGHWNALGLQTNLSLAALYDASIQHGDGDDPDGLGKMIDRTSQRAGGTPATGVDEATWLQQFLEVRRETLEFATEPSTRVGWAESTERVAVFQNLLDSGNMDVDGPIIMHVYGDSFTVP